MIHDKHGKEVITTHTPASVELRRKDKFIWPARYTATIEKPGYKPATVPIESTINPWVVGNVVVGGVIGLAVDNATGRRVETEGGVDRAGRSSRSTWPSSRRPSAHPAIRRSRTSKSSRRRPSTGAIILRFVARNWCKTTSPNARIFEFCNRVFLRRFVSYVPAMICDSRFGAKLDPT